MYRSYETCWLWIIWRWRLMAIKYRQTWGWNLMNINRGGIWRWNITLLFDWRYTLDRRIIKPNSFWMLAYSLFCFWNCLKNDEIFPSHRIYMYLPTYYSSTVLFIFECEKIILWVVQICKKVTWTYASTHTKNTLRPVLLATVLSDAEDWKRAF